MGTKGESKDPENLSLTIPVQGILPNLYLLAVAWPVPVQKRETPRNIPVEERPFKAAKSELKPFVILSEPA